MRYLTVAEVLLIHETELRNYGGMSGLRSIALLESAVYRPQTSYGGNELYDTAWEKAACLIQAIIKNHPFVDGNKRTAMVAGAMFLRLNGYNTKMGQKELVNVAIETALDKLSVKQISEILLEKSEQIK